VSSPKRSDQWNCMAQIRARLLARGITDVSPVA
jgi:hypothetical protein